MTLCVGFIRKEGKKEELVFATDSCLSAGERWSAGIKLFELPRKDCIICFAGSSIRTYPLILNLISSIKFDKDLANPHTDLNDVLDYVVVMFKDLMDTLDFSGLNNPDPVLDIGEFSFLFGGWSWKQNCFQLWRLYYDHATGGFLYDEFPDGEMPYLFIGDHLEHTDGFIDDELTKSRRIRANSFDMEPYQVLLRMIRDDQFDGIDGPIQLAKIHPPGITEFLGLYWPAAGGNRTFLGKDVSTANIPTVKFMDPDSCKIIGDDLPPRITEPTVEVYGINFEFVKKCYPAPSFALKADVTKRQSLILGRIFKEIAYQKYLLAHAEEAAETTNPEA